MQLNTSAPKLVPSRGLLELRLDPVTGLPAAIATRAGDLAVPLSFGIELETGGREVPGTSGGIAYVDTDRHFGTTLAPDSLEHTTRGPEETLSVRTQAGTWQIRTCVTFRDEHPRVELRIAVSPVQGADETVLRDLHLRLTLGDARSWRVETPGNMLRPGVSAMEIQERIDILTAGNLTGAPGIVVVHDDERPASLVFWPLSRAESGNITLESGVEGLDIRYQTQLGGVVPPGEWIEHGPVYLDLVERPWSELRRELRGWYPSVGVGTPRDQPEWGSHANLFEATVGPTPFYDDHEYNPYPTLADLVADLDRISKLGFDCVQLMPRQPYPSYNIHTPGDVTTTWGRPDELRALIDGCHARGMRLILDILMHGVIDHASIDRAVAVVHSGPHMERLRERCADPYTMVSREISWSRHILAFEPHWRAGAPAHHTLLDEHPEWFMRDSAGDVTGIYTNALDIANEEWQDRYVDGCVAIVRDYGIDGFRLDAPLYNEFGNWSQATRRHASYSNLGCRRLFRKLRRRLRAVNPDVLVYTEPSGPLLREAIDLTYSYEEFWLIPSLYPPDHDPGPDWRRVRNGRELSAWFRDFDQALPAGSYSAHALDCHDTMWWRINGDHWRREQIGLPATKAMLAVHALRPGSYMTFIGGETGIEAELTIAHALRRLLPEIARGTADYDAVSTDHDAVYSVLLRGAGRAALVVVNVTDAPVKVRAEVATNDGERPERVFDGWAGEWLAGPRPGDGTSTFDLELEPFQARALLLSEPPAEVLGLYGDGERAQA
jgi:glycosidase